VFDNHIPADAVPQPPAVQRHQISIEAGATIQDQIPIYEKVQPRLDPPLEITRDMLCLMAVVDENVVITRSQIQQDVD